MRHDVLAVTIAALKTGATVMLFVLALVVLSQCVSPSPVYAAELTPEKARAAYVVAYGQYSGPPEWLNKPPTVLVADSDQLCDIVGREPGCKALGAYKYGSVFISKDLDFDTPFGVSYLVHEFVHHLQWLHHGAAEDQSAATPHVSACFIWHMREAQAYRIQGNVLTGMHESELAQSSYRQSARFKQQRLSCKDELRI